MRKGEREIQLNRNVLEHLHKVLHNSTLVQVLCAMETRALHFDARGKDFLFPSAYSIDKHKVKRYKAEKSKMY